MSAPENEKQDQARNLYFQTGLNQSQIAALIGVSQKTVSLWINEGKWKTLKERAEQSPIIFIEQMVSELQELHCAIASRPVGERFATLQEAEVRRKITLSIKSLQEQQTAGVHAEVLTNFTSYVSRKSTEHAQILVQYADRYLRGEKMMSMGPQFRKYTIPGEMDENNFTPPSPADNSARAA